MGTSCPSGLVKCGQGSCANLASDATNCGGCGNRCSAGQSCVQGRCRSGSASLFEPTAEEVSQVVPLRMSDLQKEYSTASVFVKGPEEGATQVEGPADCSPDAAV